MNKLILKTFSFCIVLSLIAGCGPDPVCPEETGFVGNYDGEHVINIPSVGIPLPTNDSIFVTNPSTGDNRVTGFSQTLNATLFCNIDCSDFTLDTVRIDSTEVQGITIKDVVAIGDGELNGSQLITRITIVSGTAYNIPIYGTKDLAGTRINGTFNK